MSLKDMDSLKGPRFEDIPQVTRGATYAVDISIGHLETQLEWFARDYKLDLDPDFQRGHVWNDKQRIAFVEFMLRGGTSGRNIYFNCPIFGNLRKKSLDMDPYYMPLVDGKQRLEAVRKFLHDEIPAFGHLFSEYQDKKYALGLGGPSFKLHVNDLQTRRELLVWYVEMNGGTIHAPEELDRVRALIAAEPDLSLRAASPKIVTP